MSREDELNIEGGDDMETVIPWSLIAEDEIEGE